MKIKAVSAMLALVMLLTGCSSMFASEYYYSEHYTKHEDGDIPAGTEIKNYQGLKDAIISMVEEHELQRELTFSNYNGSVSDDLAAVCFEIKSQTPLGAFAVDTLSYDVRRIVSYHTADIYISYKRSVEELSQIIGVSGLSNLHSRLKKAVENGDEKLTISMQSAIINDEYIANDLREICYADPLLVAVTPNIKVNSYPSEGTDKIFEITLKYAETPGELAFMKLELVNSVEKICREISGDNEALLAINCAQYLSDLSTQNTESRYPNSAYSTLVEGYGEPKGIALAFVALCNELGLECEAVEGTIGAGGTKPHTWNIVKIDGGNYHFDVSRLAEEEASAVLLLSDEDIWGNYLWDTNLYPNCRGELSFGELFPENTEETEEERAGDAPETELPEENIAEPSAATEESGEVAAE